MTNLTKEQILAEAYKQLYNTFHTATLGHWLLILSELDVKEHSILSKLNGSVAEEYYLCHYKDTSKNIGENK